MKILSVKTLSCIITHHKFDKNIKLFTFDHFPLDVNFIFYY